MNIGVVSDTHGLLRPEVLTALAGVDHILHLGDVGNPSILKSLQKLHPFTQCAAISIAPARAAACLKPTSCSSKATIFICSTTWELFISIRWLQSSPQFCMVTPTGPSLNSAKECSTSIPVPAARGDLICRQRLACCTSAGMPFLLKLWISLQAPPRKSQRSFRMTVEPPAPSCLLHV